MDTLTYLRRCWFEVICLAVLWAGMWYFHDLVVATLLCVFLVVISICSACGDEHERRGGKR